ncbi:hypothetical protein OHS70_34395 [Streptomyces sp. NBC_00390]|uniref:hypothetical protein n=1 Tax=Streptomyces sp. NBC_00390 TaxID=2975736 RepID=UPI002E20052A
MRRWRHVAVWVGIAVGGGAAVGLGALAAWGDLDTADQMASVFGAVAGIVGLAVSVFSLIRNDGTGSEVGAWGARSIAVGGGVARAVTGDNNHLGPAPTLTERAAGAAPGSPSGPTVRAVGDRSVAAGGDIADAVTGDGNQP